MCCCNCRKLGSSLRSGELFLFSGFRSCLSFWAFKIATRSSTSRPRARSSLSSDSKSFNDSDRCWFRRRSSSTCWTNFGQISRLCPVLDVMKPSTAVTYGRKLRRQCYKTFLRPYFTPTEPSSGVITHVYSRHWQRRNNTTAVEGFITSSTGLEVEWAKAWAENPKLIVTLSVYEPQGLA